jgi:GxxExxY protein
LTERAGRPPFAPQLEARDGLLFPDLTAEIVAGLHQVHHDLGVGFVHRIYANACYREMQSRGLESRACREMTVFYRRDAIGQVKLKHLLVEGCVMIFPVAVADVGQIEPENLRRWMASEGISLGILANFQAARLDPVFMRV